jgi:N-acetylglucosamine kinase-like BadF-type ATPase
MSKFLLGVDGGNTKTDYLLATLDGEVVASLRAPTASHECFDDGFDGMERAMRTQLAQLFVHNSITVSDIAAAGMGLAGADHPWQVAELEKRVRAIGFTRFAVANDGILGVKAVSTDGTGLCAVNGTGTVVVGMDGDGQILQVGGIGRLTGDHAGGSHIRDHAMAALYNFHYRCGTNSEMFPKLMQLFSATVDSLSSIIADWEALHRGMKAIMEIAAEAAENGDHVARQIFDDAVKNIAHSAAGCVGKLNFTGEITIVQVGSIWHKTAYTGQHAAFSRELASLLPGRELNIIPLTEPPAIGGIRWAKELINSPIT